MAGGNGEQVLSRDVYRLGQLFDFFRMLSFFYTTVGYYMCTMVNTNLLLYFLRNLFMISSILNLSQNNFNADDSSHSVHILVWKSMPGKLIEPEN